MREPRIPMLQWGHGDEAVEEACGCETSLRANGWLQWGHGDEAVEERSNRGSFAVTESGFNGATAMKPWKRRAGSSLDRKLLTSFNGATAMKPWKRKQTAGREPNSATLQWGHGDEAVEEMAYRV